VTKRKPRSVPPVSWNVLGNEPQFRLCAACAVWFCGAGGC
jgi:hypothetical protein